MRHSNRIAGALVCASIAFSISTTFVRPAFADELPGEEVPVEPAPAPAVEEPTSLTLKDLGVDDSVIEPPGFKQWALDTTVISTVTWGATLGLNKNIRDGVMNSSSEQWGKNLRTAPQWNDGSDTVTNWVAHPLLGASWFLAYRSRGHGFVASSLGLMFQSFFLEYVIESPHNVPSAHDLVITPLLGIPIGYGLDTLSVYMLEKKDTRWRYLGYVFNPFHLLPSAKKHRWDVAIDPANKSFAISGRF